MSTRAGQENGVPAGIGSRVWLSRSLGLFILFCFALGLRVYKLDQPPLDFHPTRQYRSALLARLFYFERAPETPAWRLEVCRKAAPPVYEPPVLERLSAVVYGVTGRERLWIPRLLSCFVWMLGGLAVLACARRLGGEWGGWVAVAFFWFLPFGVEASRAFMPDPLMVALLATVLWALLRLAEGGGSRWLAVAAVAAGAATFVKPMAVFQVTFAAVALAAGWWKEGRRAEGVRLLAAVGLCLFPAAAFYLRSYTSGGAASFMAAQSFMPSLLITAGFWQGWLGQVWRVTGFLPVAAALIGTALAGRAGPFRILAGAWCGYLVFVAAFTYHNHTHDYYSLQLVPLVAIAAAPLIGRLAESLTVTRFWGGSLGRSVPVLLLAAGVMDAATDRYDAMRHLDFSDEIALYQKVGGLTGHSRETILLADFYGHPLEYHGEVTGRYWPHWFDERLDSLLGKPSVPASKRLDSLLNRRPARFFVATNMRELALQSELATHLDATYTVLDRTGRFTIWDLQPISEAER